MRAPRAGRRPPVRVPTKLTLAAALGALALGSFGGLGCREKVRGGEAPEAGRAPGGRAAQGGVAEGEAAGARPVEGGAAEARPAGGAAGARPAEGGASGVRPSRGEAAGGGAPGGGEGASVAPFALAPGIWLRDATIAGESGQRFAWRALRVELRSAALSVVPVPGARLERLADDASLLFAVNAGFFEPSFEPSGLLVSRGRRLGALAARGGSGVLWVAGGRARLLPSDGPLPGLAGAELALQCGPRLVEGGRPGVRRDDGQRAARTALCLREGGRVLDVILTWDPAHPGEGPGLLRLAELLALPSPAGDAVGCEDALNLDGGPSTGLVVRAAAASPGPRAPGPVPWALAVAKP